MKVFCISGLGADHRSFGRLTLPNHDLIPVPWIPNLPNESLSNYALRLGESIEIDSAFALLGLSFGGMLAMEMAEALKPAHLILLSSAADPNELPRLYRWANALHLQKYIPSKLLRAPAGIAHWHMGVRKTEDKALFNEILAETDFEFAKWAIGAITSWEKMNDYPCSRVHGDADNILPCPLEALRIEGAGHLAVFTHAQRVSEQLARILN